MDIVVNAGGYGFECIKVHDFFLFMGSEEVRGYPFQQILLIVNINEY